MNNSQGTKSVYEMSLKIFFELSEKHLPAKGLQVPWITNGTRNYRNQNYRNQKKPNNYSKNYKHLFEKFCKKAKQTHYKSFPRDCQNDIKHIANS